MPIIKIDSRIEEYRERAKSKDLNELSGRTNRKDLTDFICLNILKALELESSDIILDIGCGDGTLLLKASPYIHSGFGVLPTSEEVYRVQKVFADIPNIEVRAGIAQKTVFFDHSFDKIVCNGVLLFLEEDEIVKALKEIKRIAKKGSLIFIGEIPRKDEFRGRNYGNSISRWLLWVLKHQGFKEFSQRFKQVLRASFSDEPFIIFPKKHYYAKPDRFIKLAEYCGLQLIKSFKHRTMSISGEVFNCPSRQNYIFQA
jgi:SAM-dependent methyltransferase